MAELEYLDAFRGELLGWFARHQRDLPWRRTEDPYAILLSEIMLQQTRVAAVIPYFERFLLHYPTVESLANAQESELLSNWAGLGYYYRARNLQKAAQAIVRVGAFPNTYAALLQLPGVGDYTASAVSSIAFGLPHAVLDGNVFRVLSRYFADFTNVASLAGKKHFAYLANQLLDRQCPGTFNQAMMELGATVCLPKSPQCLLCPIAFGCQAKQQQRTGELPIKIIDRRTHKVDRLLYWIQQGDAVLAWQRGVDSRLMPGFWELPETEQLPNAITGKVVGAFRHGITIYDYRFKIAAAAVPAEVGLCRWLTAKDLQTLPLSTVFRKAVRVVNNGKPTLRAKAAGSL